MSSAHCQCKDCVCSFTLRVRGAQHPAWGSGVCVLPAIKSLLNCYTELLEQSKAAFMLLSTWPAIFFPWFYCIFYSIIAISHFISFTILRQSMHSWWFTTCDFLPFIYSSAFYFKSLKSTQKNLPEMYNFWVKSVLQSIQIIHTGQYGERMPSF